MSVSASLNPKNTTVYDFTENLANKPFPERVSCIRTSIKDRHTHAYQSYLSAQHLVIPPPSELNSYTLLCISIFAASVSMIGSCMPIPSHVAFAEVQVAAGCLVLAQETGYSVYQKTFPRACRR